MGACRARRLGAVQAGTPLFVGVVLTNASVDRWCGDAAGDELQRCGAGCAATGSTSRRIGSLRGLQRTGRKL